MTHIKTAIVAITIGACACAVFLLLTGCDSAASERVCTAQYPCIETDGGTVGGVPALVMMPPTPTPAVFDGPVVPLVCRESSDGMALRCTVGTYEIIGLSCDIAPRCWETL